MQSPQGSYVPAASRVHTPQGPASRSPQLPNQFANSPFRIRHLNCVSTLRSWRHLLLELPVQCPHQSPHHTTATHRVCPRVQRQLQGWRRRVHLHPPTISNTAGEQRRGLRWEGGLPAWILPHPAALWRKQRCGQKRPRLSASDSTQCCHLGWPVHQTDELACPETTTGQLLVEWAGQWRLVDWAGWSA